MLLYSNRNMKFFTILYLFLAIINLTISQEWCPADCECKIVDDRNQAICKSIQGILEGKNLPIHSIILSNTNLTKISHLDKLRDLTDIDVSNNHLSDIDHLGRRIKNLNLSHNKITSAKLTNIPQHVEHLDLSYNEITYLPLELTIKLRKLKTIELIGNKINCTCETLEVRNWLQSIHVSTNNFIKCSYPVNVKDLPWLQVKQKELCDDEQKQNYDKVDDHENELMLGDQPANDGSDEKESLEELGKDYLPVERKKNKRTATLGDDYDDEIEDASGGGPLPTIDNLLTPTDGQIDETTNDDADDDGSGSGFGGIGDIDIPKVITEKEFDDLISNNENENGTEPISAPIEEPTTQDVLGASASVFAQLPNDDVSNEEASENPIVPEHQDIDLQKTIGDVIINDPNGNNGAENDNYINKAGENESRGTYILLGVILLVVVALLIFVAIKRMQTKRSNNNNYDAENPKGTELSNMDKKNLGKPMQKNGGGNYEHKPLIGEKSKDAKPINGNNNNNNRKIADEPDAKTHEPLLNGLPNESNNNDTPFKPSEQTYDPNSDNQPKSPKEPRYGSYPPPKSPKSNGSPATTSDIDDKPALPSSPTLGRYSPVYSPETGKVKIKLSETPKPKTPMLVTRSRSNAGEITTKPTADVVDNNKQ